MRMGKMRKSIIDSNYNGTHVQSETECLFNKRTNKQIEEPHPESLQRIPLKWRRPGCNTTIFTQ